MQKYYIHFPPVHTASLVTFTTYSLKIQQILRGKFLGILFTIGTKEWEKSNQCAHDQWDIEYLQLHKYRTYTILVRKHHQGLTALMGEDNVKLDFCYIKVQSVVEPSSFGFLQAWN